MTPINHIRFVQAATLAAIVAVCLGPTAALGRPAPRPVPDAFERYVAVHPYGRGVIDAGEAPDIFERYVKSHHALSTVVVDGRSPDTLDAADTAQRQISDGRSPDTLDAAQSVQVQVPDGRSPDTRDATETVQPVEIVTSGGFNWSDAGIGAATGGGLILLMGASLVLLLWAHRRHDVQAT